MRFAFWLPDQERAWLVHQLNRFLGTSGQDEERQVIPSTATIPLTKYSGESSGSNGTLTATDVLVFEHTLAEPPTDCRWHIGEDDDTFAFQERGRLSIGAVAALLFLNAFWNGIVSVFVMQLLGQMPVKNPLQGGEWWCLFVFLIPFEAIGLTMLAMLVLQVLEPWRRTAWRFERDRIVNQTRWPWYCHTRTWDAVELDRLELRRRDQDNPQLRHAWQVTTALAGLAPFDLALVSGDNVDLCNIGNLTEGEARWMARILLGRRPKWFSK